jgi:hypothetical protein
MKLLIAALAFVGLMSGTFGIAQAADKHLFYVHGCCVKDKDDPKAKAYEVIIQDLKKSGFDVVFELRYSDVADSDAAAHAYAAKVAGRVQALIAKGTVPEDITVAGYSLGSMTTLVASGLISNPKVNFVLIAGCPVNSKVKVTIDYSKVQGRILSIVDTKDENFGSCNGRLPVGIIHQEIVVNSGKGHALFWQPDEQLIKLWKEPLVAWANGK